MNEEVVQWLTEIRSLQEELTQCRSDRDTSDKSAAHWRELYSTEAQQRRVEARLARENLHRLEREIGQLKTGGVGNASTSDEERAAVEAEVLALKDIESLQQKLIAAIEERDRALAALKVEQEQHQQTRDSLTAIISDTVEQLSQYR